MLRYFQILFITLSLCLFTACKKEPQTETQANQTATTDSSIKAKQVMDKASNDIDDAVGNKLEQMASLDITDLYNDPQAYLTFNSKKPGVKVTESGLQYRVIKQASGPKPDIDNTVRVHYRGLFPNGDEFDSSHKRGEPTEFPVKGVIKGWTEALLLMNEGSTYELVIPAELAYGKRGAGNIIPPDQVLKFEVELLKSEVN